MKIKQILFGTSPDANAGILILRVFIGAAMMTHGIPKMFGGLEKFTGFVESLGVPAPQVMAFLAAFAESFGALLLAIGLLTRPAAFMLICTMVVAIFGAHGSDGFAKQELAWLYLVPALMFMLKGAGKWSLDFLISKNKSV
jgi:putative oxidoreductase